MKIRSATPDYHKKPHLLNLVGRPTKMLCPKHSRIYRYISKNYLIFMVMTQINHAIGSEVDLNKSDKEYNVNIPYQTIKVSECNKGLRKQSTLLLQMRNENQKLHRHINYLLDIKIEKRHSIIEKTDNKISELDGL